MPTKYAMTQDRFNARREFNQILFDNMKIGDRKKIARVHCMLALNHCISRDFTNLLISEYEEAEYLEIKGDEIERK